MLRPKLHRVLQLILRSKEGPTGGQVPDALQITFPPLWQLTPTEEATRRKTVAETDVAYVEAGIVTAEEVAASRFRPEGWSAETQVDMDVRRGMQGADKAAADGKLLADPSRGGDHAGAVGDVVARVAGREIPRDAGVAQLQASLGLSPEEAEAAMGEAGRSFFTKPDPSDAATQAARDADHAKLQRSAASLKNVLRRVLAKNKAGELVQGSPVTAGGNGADVPDEELDAIVAAVEKAEDADNGQKVVAT